MPTLAGAKEHILQMCLYIVIDLGNELFAPQPRAYRSLGPKCHPVPSPTAVSASQSGPANVIWVSQFSNGFLTLGYSAKQGFSLPSYFLLGLG